MALAAEAAHEEQAGWRLRSVEIPGFIYGTAWKEDETARLVLLALGKGFTAIDTANQRKHYHEAAVGEALATAFAKGLRRESLFLQTKFTDLGGQDHRLPYDAAAPPEVQVRQSLASSLVHLGVERVDALLLHGPSAREGLSARDLQIYRAMEALHDEGRVGLIGVSNFSASQLLLLCNEARVQPAVVQNRCYARQGWDREVRRLCRERGVVYQGFSLLTANSGELRRPALQRIAARHGATPAQVVFRFARQVGMVCLTGSSSPVHLAEDLACGRFTLEPDELETIESLDRATAPPRP